MDNVTIAVSLQTSHKSHIGYIAFALRVHSLTLHYSLSLSTCFSTLSSSLTTIYNILLYYTFSGADLPAVRGRTAANERAGGGGDTSKVAHYGRKLLQLIESEMAGRTLYD
jgi:hypothetical protein